MSLSQIISDLTAHFESARADAERFAQEHLPVLQDAERAASNPLVQAALSVVHVSPAIMQGLADTLLKFEADLAAAAPPPEPEPAVPDGAAPAEAVP